MSKAVFMSGRVPLFICTLFACVFVEHIFLLSTFCVFLRFIRVFAVLLLNRPRKNITLLCFCKFCGIVNRLTAHLLVYNLQAVNIMK